jgi:nucleoside-diphosphate-sugar epimerase
LKILLTGGNGFIGTFFVSNYTAKYTIKAFSFLKNDLSSLKCNEFDTILHLSALVHQMNGAGPEEYDKINVMQTLQLAQKAKIEGVSHFVFMSTVKVYGEENDLAYMETSSCFPQDDYGKSKLKAERELQKLQDENFTVSIIRTPIVYGHGVKANIRNLIDLVKKFPIIPLGGIKNQRSMVYIGNLCHLIDIVIEKKHSGVFLASDDEPLSTTDLVRKIANAAQRKRYLIILPFFEFLLKKLKPSFHQRLYGNLIVNNTQTKQHLNLQNPYSTDEGINLMVQGNT